MIDEDIKKLDELSKKMESGALTLEQSLLVFQEGIALIRKCTQTLESAELKVKEIIETQGSLSAVPFQKPQNG
jgi:exodeoxyribonuclease VII small subunit